MGNESRRIEIEDYILCIESRLRHLTDGGMVSINVKFLFACDIAVSHLSGEIGKNNFKR